MEQEHKDLEQHFSELPVEVQNLIASTDLDAEIAKIPEAEPLQDVQKMQIKNEVTKVMLGLSAPIEMTTLIKMNAEIARDRAETISKRLQEAVFVPNASVLAMIFDLPETDNTKPADEVGQIHNDIQPRHTTDPASAPTSSALPETQPSSAPQKVESDESDALNVFGKRLEQPVHTAVKEEIITTPEKAVARGEANQSPSSAEQIAADPYKESIE